MTSCNEQPDATIIDNGTIIQLNISYTCVQQANRNNTESSDTDSHEHHTNDGAQEEDGFIYSFFSGIHIPIWLQYCLDVLMCYPLVLCMLGVLSNVTGKAGPFFQS